MSVRYARQEEAGPAWAGGAVSASQPAVLLADDDAELTQMLAEFFADEPFELHVAPDGAIAAEMVDRRNFDLLLLDVMLPRLSGFDVLRQIRRMSSMPVIMMTARTAQEDRIEGLQSGADDYVCKPFSPAELLARMHAVLRRTLSRPLQHEPGIAVGALRVVPSTQRAYMAGEALALTSAELRILEILMRHAGTPVTREHLTEAALGRQLEAYDRSLDTHVSNLRRKLRQCRGAAPEIRGLRNLGYMLLAGGA
ncbi:MAG: response regulator transcription factor [Pigmentiphaga sp.]|uniref:response regulator transcription factor n=1 Tax=Pigmentiphaga sp. TaxID=1977564 RepID=UPI0029AAAAED|nr:response regulator transcription factor [Pigmentiphaga sp.]MDX3906454.1 response regulator transcription factor [Pigmentiphaga sp.]